jgi:nicotinamidase-related amidase
MPLVDHRDSVLVVVDAQEAFYAGSLPHADRAGAEQALARMTWLVKVASLLEIPLVLTEEEPERNGATFAPLAEVAGSPAQVKPTFGLAGTPEILASIEATGRRTAVLAGFETDVCVAQSSIGLKERDLRVVVVEDAVFSPGEMHARGLARIAAAGVELNHCKGLAYEWTRTVDESRRVLGAPELGEPPFRL